MARPLPHCLARLVPTLLAGLALLAGTLDLHAPAAAHHADGLRATTVSAGASHPAEREHVESTRVERSPECPTCLLQVQSAGLAPEPPQAHPLLKPREASSGRPEATPPVPSLRTGSPRAPPAPTVTA